MQLEWQEHSDWGLGVVARLCTHFVGLPVIQNQNKFPSFEGQFIIFSCLKVVERADFADLLSIRVARGVRVHDERPCLRLLLLLLQGQLDGCRGGGLGWEEKRDAGG